MSDEPCPYNPCYIQAWTILSIVLGVVLFGLFIFGDPLLQAGHIAWALLRWICRGII